MASVAGRCVVQWGRPEGMRRVTAPSAVVTGVHGGRASFGDARASVAGCRRGLRAATGRGGAGERSAARVGRRGREGRGCFVGGTREASEGWGRWCGHRSCRRRAGRGERCQLQRGRQAGWLGARGRAGDGGHWGHRRQGVVRRGEGGRRGMRVRAASSDGAWRLAGGGKRCPCRQTGQGGKGL